MILLFAGLFGRATAIMCPNNYYAVGNVCVGCGDAMAGCLACMDFGACTHCADRYYLDGGYCKPCDSSCATCDNVSKCLTCTPGYCRSSSGVCEPAGEVFDGCSKCAPDINVCTGCLEGYFFDINTKKCTACGEHCLKCRSATECEKASEGYRINPGGTNPERCTDLNCGVCDGAAGTCEKCIGGYYVSSGTCTKCTTSGCKECTADGRCQSCLTGYVLTYEACWPCADNCNNCLLDDIPLPYSCIDGGCNEGYRYSPEQRNCIPCSPGCATCYTNLTRGVGMCNGCTDPSKTVVGKNIYGILCSAPEKKPCLSNQFQENEDCVNCDVSIMGCNTCTDRYTCTACARGFYLSNDLCILCDPECRECSGSPNSCTSCAPTLGFKDGKCVPIGELFLNCKNGYDIDGVTTCLNCIDGYYLTGEQKCIPCFDKCKFCSSPDIDGCWDAVDGYHLKWPTNGGSKTIVQCTVEKCTSCGYDENTCSLCETGYAISNNSTTCTKGTIENCFRYVDGQNKCAECIAGYGASGLNSDVCEACHKGCKTCPHPEICDFGACEDGYYLSPQDKRCMKCPPGCSICKIFSDNNNVLGCMRCISDRVMMLLPHYGLFCGDIPLPTNKSTLQPGIVAAIVILVLLLIGVCVAMPFVVRIFIKRSALRRRIDHLDRSAADSLLPDASASSI